MYIDLTGAGTPTYCAGQRSPTSSSRIFQAMLALPATTTVTGGSRDLNPLHDWVMSELAIELCPECSSAVGKDYTTSQQEFWNRMPIIFGLPSWEELRNERRDAMGKNVVSIA
ncbi:hypothetical protein DFH09DRAFT_1077500 [Mycena vulgaris]|nr:hypothetical protein DFH09DRAFT_1077500 [Mycena vulgaris]